ncbi:LuxR C-terminal-related transcriptional regulator [Gracilimonas sp.]|uniref:LuxR C-terminal-related transcriptional regulator n=1 Tax=Gracilimonas sp. TaxID=1974203 RepID=UPI0028715EA2|nr:LuxR C-terminal-related transcriptional regulator [Gracilimonas sp.]
MKRLLTYTFIISIIGTVSAISQSFPEKGVPLMQNYPPASYHHQGKIWDIDTAPNGIIYMAADKGLLEYDGRNWTSFKGSEGIVRSVLVVDDSLIYTGSDLDFGVWKKNKFQKFEYTSLYPFKEDLNEINEEFWGVYLVNGNIFFVSSSNIYVYDDGNLTKISVSGTIKNSFDTNNELYFINNEGLYKLEALAVSKVVDFPTGYSPEVIDIYKADNSDDLILVTKDKGLIQFASGNFRSLHTNLSEKLISSNVFSFATIGDSHLAFGTVLSGLFITDLEGNIVHHINKSKGLQNNTVLSLHYSKNRKLWVGLDYGITSVSLNSAYTFFNDYLGNFGTGYSAFLENDVFYLGTNQGLYSVPWDELDNSSSNENISLIPGTEGQVWDLKVIAGQILVGHDKGLYSLQGQQFESLYNRQGVWTVEATNDHLFAGNYNGISIFEKQDGEWTFLKNMELIVGAVTQIVIENDETIWVNIPNYGIIKIKLNESIEPTNREFFPEANFEGDDLILSKNEGQMEVITETNVYGFDAAAGDFTLQDIRNTDKVIQEVLLQNKKPVQLNSNYEFIPIYNGFALRDVRIGDYQNVNNSNTLLIRKIEAFTNDHQMQAFNGAELPYQFNNLRVEAIVPNADNVRYQFKKGTDDGWGNWLDEGVVELIGLDYGARSIQVRAKVKESITEAQTIQIDIKAPWYLSWYAYFFYTLFVIGLAYLLYRWQNKSLNQQKKKLLLNQRNSLREQKEIHQQQLQIVEEEKMKAEYEKMKAQLRSKTVELATKTKENDEKNRILKALKKKIKNIEQNPKSFERKSAEIKQIIDSHIDAEDEIFEIQIDELHQEFYDKLRKKFPDLTRYDLRLCAYIKIGFDSKEIADLLNIKPSSVYISRSRLRKKLNIETDEDLHSYLNSV